MRKQPELEFFSNNPYRPIRKQGEGASHNLSSHCDKNASAQTLPPRETISLGSSYKEQTRITYSDSYGIKTTHWLESHRTKIWRKKLERQGFFINRIQTKETHFDLFLLPNNDLVKDITREILR